MNQIYIYIYIQLVSLSPSLSPSYLDRPLHLRLLVAQPHHSHNGHGDTQPVEEAEEVDNGEDVIGEGVEQGHGTLWKA